MSVAGDPDGVLIGGREDRTIEIVGYQAEWPERFERERARIDAALGGTVRIEHVGSTAVPGLAAKPIVDVMVTVDDPDDEPVYLPALEMAGYVLRVREPGHRMLRSPDLGVHVHVWPADSEDERRHLVFRDRLRSSADDRAEYETAKRDLATRFRDMNAYADAKGEVIARILERARRDRSSAVVQTERLVLRPWTSGDLDALATIFASPSVWHYPFRRGFDREWTERFLARHIRHREEHGFAVWAAEMGADRTLIGYIGLAIPTWLPEVLPAVEVGWRLHPDYWHRGLATEGAWASLGHGFDHLGLDRIISICDADNVASRRVMERVGMRRCLRMTDPERGDPLEVFEMARKDWRGAG